MDKQQEPFIIYADDDIDDLSILGETLKGATGAQVILGFTNGRQVLNYLEALPPGANLPNLIILDLNMPGLNGLETLDALKKAQAYCGIPVYIFTNSNYPAHRQASIGKGAEGFITKPFSYKDLKEVCHAFAAYLLHPVKTKQL